MIRIKSRICNYQVKFGNASLFLGKIENAYPLNCYLIDETVWSLYYKKLFKNIDRKKVILLRANENKKNLKTVQDLYGILTKRSVKRNLTLIAIGGGITQDISGFLASTLYRGIRWIFIPSTLLAQGDSCIGSKTSLNYKGFKNLVGTFYPPFKVFIDANFVKTQDAVDFYSGLGEIVKLHITGGKKYCEYILAKLPLVINKRRPELLKAVYNSLIIKKRYIEADEFDQGKRNLLNFGHCFGHALETASNFYISHGQAVILGIVFANIISEKRGFLSKDSAKRLFDYGLSRIIFNKNNRFSAIVERIIAAMKKDKKRTGNKLPLIVLKDRFKLVKLNDLTGSEVKAAVLRLDNLLDKQFNN